IGVVCAITEWSAQRPAIERRGWVAALVVAAPSLAVTMPVCATLFDGAYAQTLPLAALLPYAGPFVLWLLITAAVAIGKRLAAGDLVSRTLPILALAGVAGGVMMARRKLGTGYLEAQLGATIAVIVIAGAIARQARRARPPVLVTLAIVAITLGTASAALEGGLSFELDRRQITAMAGQARDVVELWRGLFDRDDDNSSRVLGGGDCDDGDPTIGPGGIDLPGDGIDQDCTDGDAVVVVARPPPAPPTPDQVAFRWSLEPSVLLERTKGMNVVLVTVDALRFDALAPDAPNRDDFPRLVKLLDESVFFTRAIAPASGTDVSIGTLLTGRHDPFQAIDVTLPEAIRATGRLTAYALPGEVLRHVGEVMLGRGFEQQRKVHTDWETQDIGDHVSGAASNEEILKAIGQAKARPFFAWVHYFDVHEHHQIQPGRELRRAVHPGAGEVEHRYRAMLASVDRSTGRLLDELDKRGLRDSTIVVFASDHGESLKEDPRLLDTHGIVTYSPLVRIPIAFRIPGVAPGRRVDPVSLVDLSPTLLTLIGIPHSMGKLDGFDLTAALLDGPAELRPPVDRALVIHEERQWSVVQWPYQLIVSPGDDVVELYDLAADPAQRDDLATKLPDVTRRLRARYAEVPQVRVDRTLDGRAWREQQALPPPRRAPP
ncbi:MAG: sulfatase, partial [Deltaproteobacteria bacterium]|nr:sulfatase [Deltaproteobacteria bacterium]